MQRVDVDSVTQRFDGTGDQLRRVLHHVSLAGNHRFFSHPDQHCFDRVRRHWNVAGFHNHVAPAGIHFVIKSQRDCKWGVGFIQVSVVGDDLFDMRCLFAGHDHHFIALADDA